MSKLKSGKTRKSIALLVSLAAIFLFSVSGVVAYIIASTVDVANTFTPAKVTCKVEENFDGTTKSDVSIQNTGDTEAYIRAAIVVNWVDANGNIYGERPVRDTESPEYILTLDNSDWTVCQSDGFYYHKAPVAATGRTSVLIKECKLKEGVTPPEGYDLQVEVLASAIQSTPTKAVTESWGVALDGNNITGLAPVTP